MLILGSANNGVLILSDHNTVVQIFKMINRTMLFIAGFVSFLADFFISRTCDVLITFFTNLIYFQTLRFSCTVFSRTALCTKSSANTFIAESVYKIQCFDEFNLKKKKEGD